MAMGVAVSEETDSRPAATREKPGEYGARIVRWIARLLSCPDVFPRFCKTIVHEDVHRHIFETLGLDPHEYRDFKNNTGQRQSLSHQLARLGNHPVQGDDPMSRNLQSLSDVLGLTHAEKELLLFAVLVKEDSVLENAYVFLNGVDRHKYIQDLSRVLDLSREDLSRAFRRDGVLYTSGLLQVDWKNSRTRETRFEVLDGLIESLFDEAHEPLEMLKAYFRPSPPPRHGIREYPHLEDDLSVLADLLRSALKQSVVGVNVLFYGPSGTGKTQLVRALAAHLGVCLYEISSEDAGLSPKSGEERFKAYNLCQKVLARNRNCCILFDEVEDVFPEFFHFFHPFSLNERKSKGWTNSVLESNPIPAFWLCNEVRHIDPAFLRRFDYILRVPPPPRSVRRSVLAKNLEGLPVAQDWIDRVAENPDLTPAHIKQASKVAWLVETTDPGKLERAVESAIRNTMDVMQLPVTFNRSCLSDGPRYSLDFLNANHDLAQLTEGLKQRPAARLCLYGPPGSGKTAYARYLAGQLDKPLIQKRASDLLSMWVGGTEKNIAKMFRQAATEGALLLLDEADSFLQDRRGAHHSWEVTQVNELLVQMENYEGLFICSTNLMDLLDNAVLRRFDIKMRFGFLRPEQSRSLFQQTLEAKGCPVLDGRGRAALQRRLSSLDNLTPGDFASVLRQARVLGLSFDGEWLLAALEDECRVKHRESKPIRGFTE